MYVQYLIDYLSEHGNLSGAKSMHDFYNDNPLPRWHSWSAEEDDLRLDSIENDFEFRREMRVS